MELHHETKARLTKANGDPIDFVPNHSRKGGFNQDGNMMSRLYRKNCHGTAPALWMIDPTPSVRIIKNGRAHIMTVKEFRTGQRKSAQGAKVDNAGQYARLARLVGIADQPV